VDEAIVAIKEAIRLDPESDQAHQGLARAYWVGKGDFAAAIPEFERSIELNPEAGYSYLQLGLLLAWEGRYEEAERVCKRAVELQDQFISGNAGLQVVGANSRLGYVYYLQGRYDEAIREYERGLAFIGSSDHALKERTTIELNIKLGAAYHRLDRTADAARHFDRAQKVFDARVARGGDDPFTRYYVACMYALRGDRDRALDSLERVAKSLPALTAARVRRDPDLASLREAERFQVVAAG
jgi:adenylate cyclase